MTLEDRFKNELKIVGRRIKKLREDNNITQLDLEIKTGIERSDISKIENGKKNIELYTLIKLAAALNVETNELLIPFKRK